MSDELAHEFIFDIRGNQLYLPGAIFLAAGLSIAVMSSVSVGPTIAYKAFEYRVEVLKCA
ncbi:MAG: hypothetical protein VW124_23225 [Paracoccaceae bacterium]|jgi:hypothetical protein